MSITERVVSWFDQKPEVSTSAARQKDPLAEAYAIVFGSSSGQMVLDDLVQHSQDCADHAQARGRADVVLRIMQMRKKSTKEIPEEKAE